MGATTTVHGLLSRNFDFPTATLTGLLGLPPLPDGRPLTADPWIVETRPDASHAAVIVGIMDVMGGMDGVNDAGLAVALPFRAPVAEDRTFWHALYDVDDASAEIAFVRGDVGGVTRYTAPVSIIFRAAERWTGPRRRTARR